MNKPLSEHPKLLLDPYVTWAKTEGVPITEDFGIDLLSCHRALAAVRCRGRHRTSQGPR